MSTSPKLEDPDTDTLLMAKDPTTNRGPVRRGVTTQLSTISQQYDTGNKGYLDQTERVMRKYDANNDGKIDASEIKSIVQELLAVTAQKSLFKKIIVAASGLLMLSFLGNFGLTWAVLVVTRQTVVTSGALVDSHTGQMVNVQARGLTIHPEIIPESQRRLAESGDDVMGVAFLPMSPANFSYYISSAVAGAPLSFIFKVRGQRNKGVKQKKTGAVSLVGELEFRNKNGRRCDRYTITGTRAPYNVPFEVTCCDPSANQKGRCSIGCKCVDLEGMEVEWGENANNINWGANGQEFLSSSLGEGETWGPTTWGPTAETIEPTTWAPTYEGETRGLTAEMIEPKTSTDGTLSPSPTVVPSDDDDNTETGDPHLDRPRDRHLDRPRDLLSTKCIRRRHNRQLLSEVDLVSQMQQRGDESCLGEHYKLAVQALESHLLVVAVPQEGINCPMVVADSGYTLDSQELDYEEGVPVLSKHITIMEPNHVTEDEIESMLFFGNVMSLEGFYDAVQIARTSASKKSSLHGIVGNCATFILDVMTDLQIDFGKKDMQTELINFVVQALMKSEERDSIVADIKGKINSHAVKAWVRLRGDNYVLKKFVKTFLENYKID